MDGPVEGLIPSLELMKPVEKKWLGLVAGDGLGVVGHAQHAT